MPAPELKDGIRLLTESGILIKNYITFLEAELDRLKAGKFTPDELQNLCHNLTEGHKIAFCNGCDEYQRKLFGTCRTDMLKEQIQALTDKDALDYIESLQQELDSESERNATLTKELEEVKNINFELQRTVKNCLSRTG